MRAILLLCALGLSFSAPAQEPSAHLTSTSVSTSAKQFDFLVGEWTVEAAPQTGALAAMIHGVPKLVGTWRAQRAFGGRGIDDELRLSDASGNPSAWLRSLRLWSEATGQWQVAAVDAHRSRVTTATATRQADELIQLGTGVDREGRSFRNRTRFHTIGTDHFEVSIDRSYDDGVSWDEGTLTIVATRSAPAR